MASTPEAVTEMLVKKSVEYAGRPQTYSIDTRTLGKFASNCVLSVSITVLVSSARKQIRSETMLSRIHL